MKITIGGEIESEVYDSFRIARNVVLDKLNSIEIDIRDVNELSFYIYLMADFDTLPLGKYVKRYKRIEIEIIISIDSFKKANESKRIEIIKDKIIDSVNNFRSKNIDDSSVSLLKSKIKASLYTGFITENK